MKSREFDVKKEGKKLDREKFKKPILVIGGVTLLLLIVFLRHSSAIFKVKESHIFINTEVENFAIPYDMLIQRWVDTLIPKGTTISDPKYGTSYLNTNGTNAQNAWNAMKSKPDAIVSVDELWGSESFGFNPSSGWDGPITNHYQQIYAMAKGYALSGGANNLKGNVGLLEAIKYALGWMVEYGYKIHPNPSSNFNKYTTEGPGGLIDTLMLIYSELTPSEISYYLSSFDYYNANCRYLHNKSNIGSPQYQGSIATGANRANICINQLGSGILQNNLDIIDIAKVGISEPSAKILEYATSGDGFYKDGSFIFHTPVGWAYNANYGLIALSRIATFITIIDDTPIALESSKISNIYEIIDNAFLSQTFYGAMSYMTNGRGMSRRSADEIRNGATVMLRVLELYQNANPIIKTKYEQVLIDYLNNIATTYDFYEVAKNRPDLISAARNIQSNVISTNEGNVGDYRFPRMDKSMHQRENWAFAISMYSNRTAAYEGDTNGENFEGWHTADGMTYIYTKDLSQYSGNDLPNSLVGAYVGNYDGYFNTVNRKRLPGTTVDAKATPKTAGGARRYVSPQKFVGGVTLGDFGVTAMYLDKRIPDTTTGLPVVDNGTNPANNYTYKSNDAIYGTLGVLNCGGPTLTNICILPHLNMDLQAKKSWFMFDNEVIALGSGITSTLDTTVETIVDNRKLKTTGSNSFIVNNGSNQTITTSNIISGAQWAFIDGNVPGSGVGYHFPTSPTINVLKEPRTDRWYTINNASNSAFTTPNTGAYDRTNYHATLWFDHGHNPINGSYAYAVLPGVSELQMSSYVQDYTILANTVDVQAVSHIVGGSEYIGAVFWNNGKSIDIITAEEKSTIMIKKTTSEVEIAISDPTMEQSTLTIELDAKLLSVVSKDPKITVVANGNKTKFIVNTTNSGGLSFVAKITIDTLVGLNVMDEHAKVLSILIPTIPIGITRINKKERVS